MSAQAVETNDISHRKKTPVDSFVFSSVLGIGGFGTVKSALHIKSGNWYAVKDINLNLTSHKKYARNVLLINNEIKALKLCAKHPYICNLYYSFTHEQISYLVLDLFVGGDLRYHLKKGVIFSEQIAAFLITCVASALEFLHCKGILHRDIKPDNILMDENGFPSLTDFGICHLSKDVLKENHVCDLSSGTRQYVAPEVLTSTHLHGCSADYWGLGVLAYELIYGERPFEDRCPEDFIDYIESLQAMAKNCDDSSTALGNKCAKNLPAKEKLHISRPTLVMPRTSQTTQSYVSRKCRDVLQGLLDVRPDQRMKYEALSSHAWFISQGCIWEKIVHCEVVPPFIPNVIEYANDIQERNDANNSIDINIAKILVSVH
jgi:serine/threonine protein kinase